MNSFIFQLSQFLLNRIFYTAEIKELEEADLGMPKADAPEFNQFRDTLRNFDKEFNLMLSGVTGAGGKLTYSEVADIPSEEIGKGLGDDIDGKLQNIIVLVCNLQ